jgi:hypothetical protein
MKFIISNYEYLKINLNDLKIAESDKDYSNWCKDIDIEYVNIQQNISYKFANAQAQNFYHFLLEYKGTSELIEGKKVLDSSIVHDIGFEWNQFFNNVSNKTKAFDYHWMCNDHKVIRPYYNSWLYNDKDGDIIFEITPFYPWHNVNKRTQPDRIPYKKWIKSYKPTVKTIIPKENFKRWITQVEELKQKYNL